MAKAARNTVFLGRVLVELCQRFTQASLSKESFCRTGPGYQDFRRRHPTLACGVALAGALLDPGVGGEGSCKDQAEERGSPHTPCPLLPPKAQDWGVYFPPTTLSGRISGPRNQKPFVSEPESVATNPQTSKKGGESYEKGRAWVCCVGGWGRVCSEAGWIPISTFSLHMYPLPQ